MNSTDKTILFVSTERRNDLCCVFVYINPREPHDRNAKSNFHWQILKCRQIIFEHKDVIASPAFGNQDEIHVIMTKSFYHGGKFQGCLAKLKMLDHQVKQLTNAIYESCLRYTIIAHIAPLWNQVHSYLIQGRNFLEANEPLDAIHLEVEVKEDSMYVVLTPTKVKLSGFSLNDLDLSPVMRHDFKTQPNITLDVIRGQWVHVLPSMKQGKIMSVANEIPVSCPYSTYKDLKRHWKNSYGYRLPESSEGIFYCTLSFHSRILTKYTYPSICLKSSSLQFTGRPDKRKILVSFLTDLAKRMPNVCGNPFKVDGELGYTIPQGIAQIKENIRPTATLLESHSGLLPKPINQSAGCEILSSRDLNCNLAGDGNLNPIQSSCGDSSTTPRANIVREVPVCAAQNNLPRPVGNSIFTPPNNEAPKTSDAGVEKNNILSNISAILGSKQDHIIKANNRLCLNKNVDLKKETLLIDRSTLKHGPQNNWAASMARYSQTESAFASNTTESSSTPVVNNKTEFLEHGRTPMAIPSKSVGGASMKPLQPLQASIPQRAPSQPTASRTPQMFQQECKQNKYVPRFAAPSMAHAVRVQETKAITTKKYRPVFGAPAVPNNQGAQITKAAAKINSEDADLGSATRQDQSSLVAAAQSSSALKKNLSFGAQLDSKSPFSSKVHTFQEQKGSGMQSNSKPKVPAFGAKNIKLATSTLSKLPAFGSPQASVIPNKKEPAASGSQKRSATDSQFPDREIPLSGSKKPRTRPQLQTDIDVEEMARSQKLKNVNATTLLSWLHEKKVPATTRESKAILVFKVNNTLGIKEHNPESSQKDQLGHGKKSESSSINQDVSNM